MTNKSKNSPPTPEEIAEFIASAQAQLTDNIVKLINASEINKAELVAHTLCIVLIEFIRGTTDKEGLTFAEAGKIAILILKNTIKHTKYSLGDNYEVIDLKTNKEVSPGGLKQ